MKIFIRILKDSKKYRKYMLLGFIGMLVVTAVNLTSPQIIRRLVSLLTTPNSENVMQKSIKYAVILFTLYVAEYICSYLKQYYNHVAAWGYVADIRVRVYAHLQSLSMKFYQDKQTGQLMSTAANDTRDLEELIAHAIPDMIVGIITFVGILIMLILINPLLALFTLLTVPLSVFFVTRFTKVVYPLFKKSRQKQAELYAVLQDNLSGMKEIQSFNRQEGELEHIEKASDAHRDLNLKAMQMSSFFHPAVAFVTHLGTVIVIGVGGWFAAQGKIPVADIVAFMLYLTKFYEPINTLARINEMLQNTFACAERVFDLLDIESDVKEKENATELKDVKGEIDIENISFSYIDGIKVLDDISIHINPGEMVALVGHTGVGKTTISNLLNRFYDVDEGSIKIDGTDIKEVTLNSLRDNVSVVLQDVFLFNGTVEENISYGCPNATHEQIIEAAKSANADEFIKDMPQGYNTLVGERGLRLSGGQKQRISIARALLRNTPILILDEATSSVDTETEQLIREAIDNVVENRTTIVIAHRLASIKTADRIVVLQDGKVAEEGTHSELIDIKGIYAKLCEKQI